ncbi:MAG: HlyD family efflux transporter periplasmic adaptor subunit [Pseudomonadota bacterium]|nr:HlyD family efflux transporter periplasmic adaptor subunit [Pseudomonadota bacterium]
MSDAENNTAAASAAPRTHSNRKKALTGVAALVVLGGIAYGAYWALVLNHYESTDNAYVQGNVVQLTPQVGGTVVAINADDTDHVKAGQLLVKLDPADAQVALDQAEAQLAQTVREVRTLYANNSTLKAQIALREADLARARSDEARAQDDVSRRSPLVATGAVGKEEFNHSLAALAAAKSSVAAAQSAVVAAREQLSSNQTLTDGTAIDQHPNVLRAASRVREAYLALRRADLLSPVDGFVAKRSVQLGQRVPAGASLMSVIGLNDLWVEANFKESQLKNLRLGQPVTLQADVYGKKVEYKGRIEGLGAGTGSAFSLLPAQNATGNWIKVVQRVPVRIALDPKELTDHPLRVGLSMDVKADISNTDGAMLADGSRASTKAQTSVFYDNNSAADAEVRKIIAANGGSRAATSEVASVRKSVSDAAPPLAPRQGSIATVAASNAERRVGTLK